MKASDSLWTSLARDADLYKLVDVENTMRTFSEEKLIEWCDLVEKYDLNKQCYFLCDI